MTEPVSDALASEDKRLRQLFADREAADAVLAEVEDLAVAMELRTEDRNV